MLTWNGKYPLKTFPIKGKTQNWEIGLWHNGYTTCSCPADCYNPKKCKHRILFEQELLDKFGCIAEAINHYKSNK